MYQSKPTLKTVLALAVGGALSARSLSDLATALI